MRNRHRPSRQGLRLIVPDGFDAPMVLPEQPTSAVRPGGDQRRRRDDIPVLPDLRVPESRADTQPGPHPAP